MSFVEKRYHLLLCLRLIRRETSIYAVHRALSDDIVRFITSSFAATPNYEIIDEVSLDSKSEASLFQENTYSVKNVIVHDKKICCLTFSGSVRVLDASTNECLYNLNPSLTDCVAITVDTSTSNCNSIVYVVTAAGAFLAHTLNTPGPEQPVLLSDNFGLNVSILLVHAGIAYKVQDSLIEGRALPSMELVSTMSPIAGFSSVPYRICSMMIISPSTLAAGGYGGCISIYSLETKQRIQFLSGHVNCVTNMVAVGEELFTSSLDGTIHIWDLGKKHDCRNTFDVHDVGQHQQRTSIVTSSPVNKVAVNDSANILYAIIGGEPNTEQRSSLCPPSIMIWARNTKKIRNFTIRGGDCDWYCIHLVHTKTLSRCLVLHQDKMYTSGETSEWNLTVRKCVDTGKKSNSNSK